MNVHEEISKHSQKQHEALVYFLQLDGEREHYIEEAIELCRQNQQFSVDKINKVTRIILKMATTEKVPTRRLVTKEMIHEFVRQRRD